MSHDVHVDLLDNSITAHETIRQHRVGSGQDGYAARLTTIRRSGMQAVIELTHLSDQQPVTVDEGGNISLKEGPCELEVGVTLTLIRKHPEGDEWAELLRVPDALTRAAHRARVEELEATEMDGDARVIRVDRESASITVQGGGIYSVDIEGDGSTATVTTIHGARGIFDRVILRGRAAQQVVIAEGGNVRLQGGPFTLVENGTLILDFLGDGWFEMTRFD